LFFATASADGHLRFYEARDIFDLSHWEGVVRLFSGIIIRMMMINKYHRKYFPS
jgi:hypothetical protein